MKTTTNEKINQQELTAFLLDGLNGSTKAGEMRKRNGENAVNAYERGKFDGGLGCLFELWATSEKSRKTRVSSQGKADIFVKIERNGSVSYERAECKLNGGRIESLRAKNAPKYIVYALALDNSTGSYLVYPKIIKTADFLEALDEIGATKRTKGVHDEEAIQPSKRGLWAWLDEQTDYYPDTVYTEDLDEA